MEMFLYEGVGVLFQLALAYLKLCEKEILASDDFGTTFLLLQNVTRTTDWKTIVSLSNDIKVSPSKIASLRERYYKTLQDKSYISMEKEVRLQKR